MTLQAEMSESMPFLLKRPNLAGYVGDVGFDPLGISDHLDIKFLRESELKHGRAAMLATVGFVAQQYITLPGMTHVDDSNLAPTAAGLGPMLQIVFGIGALEFYMNKGKVTMLDMFDDPQRVPGEFGWGSSFLKGKSAAEVAKIQLQEIKNGRLAMLAIGGMIHHNFATGEPLL
jgi:light-harvesting complex I chlorophyll a/b binding protein 4